MGALIARVLEYRVFAIVVMTGTPPARIIEECLDNGVPVILVNKLLPGLAVDTVVADHAAGGRLAAEQLLAARMPPARARLERGAYREPRWAPECISRARGRSRSGGARLAGRTDGLSQRTGSGAGDCSRKTPFDGVFCVTDLLALGFSMPRASKFGRRVPEDLSVIGFDDIPQAGWGAYRLTTFRQPVAATDRRGDGGATAAQRKPDRAACAHDGARRAGGAIDGARTRSRGRSS